MFKDVFLHHVFLFKNCKGRSKISISKDMIIDLSIDITAVDLINGYINLSIPVKQCWANVVSTSRH